MNGGEDSFRVASVPGRRIVRVTITGAMTLDDVTRLAVAQAGLVKVLGYRPGHFDALIDSSGSPIQPVIVGDALRALSMREDFSPARLAFVHGDGSVKMQLRRLNAGKHAGYFSSVDEALSWLANDGSTGE